MNDSSPNSELVTARFRVCDTSLAINVVTATRSGKSWIVARAMSKVTGEPEKAGRGDASASEV